MSRQRVSVMRLVVNGKTAADPALRAAVRQIREEGHAPEVQVTWDAWRR